MKGTQSIIITANDEQKFIFAGEVVKNKFESILFSSNRNVLKQLFQNDWLVKQLKEKKNKSEKKDRDIKFNEDRVEEQ